MIPGSFKGITNPLEDPFPIMVYTGGLYMHELICPDYLGTKYLCRALMAQADSQYRGLACEFFYQPVRDACVLRPSRARRNNNMAWPGLFNLFKSDLIIPVDL